MEEPMLERLTAMLADQLGDRDLAADLAPRLWDVGFSWNAPTIRAGAIDCIVAYAFGNRPRPGPPAAHTASLTDRLDLPGPVNALLADAVVALRRIRPAPVFAQWEIAHCLSATPSPSDVVSIEPIVNEAGEVVYLSTEGVARAAVEAHGGDPAAMGTVAVVAHRDHLKRCVQISRAVGMNAFAAEEIELPLAYDPHSGQPWTRRRDIYLLHDMCAQLAVHRAEAIARAASE